MLSQNWTWSTNLLMTFKAMVRSNSRMHQRHVLVQYMSVSKLFVTFLTLLAVASHVHCGVLVETVFESSIVATYLAWA